MLDMLTRLLGTILAVLLSAYLVPGFSVESFYVAAIIALLLGVLNVTVKPILILLTLPLSALTLGLFVFVINAGLLYFIASFVEGFSINGFVPALLGGAIIAITGWLLNKLT